jgi:hypothetical protein
MGSATAMATVESLRAGIQADIGGMLRTNWKNCCSYQQNEPVPQNKKRGADVAPLTN